MLESAVIVAVLAAATPAGGSPIVVGSKLFTESVILGEIAAQLAGLEGEQAEHRREFGGTRILFDALERGEIDVYPEYTGTIAREILASQELDTAEEIRAALAARGVGMTGPLGFNNTYAMGVRPETAASLGLTTISDLRQHPDLRLGFSNEFMDRGDGWPALRSRYGLPQEARGLEHVLALRALAEGGLDATDLYSTDAEIAYYGFHVLVDDLNHFPRYDAVYLYRAALSDRSPGFVAALEALAGTVDEARMIEMNRRVKIGREPESAVAAAFLAETRGVDLAPPVEETFTQRQIRLLREHLTMVLTSLGLAVIIAIPLGIAAARRPRAGQLILAVVGVIQTIPALALLVLLIPLPWPREAGRPDILGVGTETAIAALFLYSLLPIVRNVQTGLTGIDPAIRDTANALGLSRRVKLLRIELPLASRTILAGIKTAAVINVGFATLGAFISAGGYGEPILTGLRLNDTGLILEGAVPAALLAILTQLLFELAERSLVPRGLRLRPQA
ncbi:MAG: ABC transporter permease/substrate-binding protein [Planctomycetota bacterium]|jgi:osmoprotectant transport system permease protein